MDQSARAVVRDFLNGKLAFHTPPPIFDDDMGDDDEMEGDQKMQ